MILAISSALLMACQGCAPVVEAPQQGAERATYQFSASEAEKPEALLSVGSSFSLVQGQTVTAPRISIQPVIGEVASRPVALEFAKPSVLSTLRLSNAAGVVNFERQRNAARLTNPARQVRDFDAELAISASDTRTGLGFDVAAVPRLSVREEGAFRQQSVGGEIRIGQNFDQRGEDVDAGSWYLFAGADGEALVYEPGGERNFTNRMALRDQVTVGDMQAGVSFERGGGQLSLSYIHREVEYNERGLKGRREAEDFAGVSFTVRR